jgi:hypothetical protein
MLPFAVFREGTKKRLLGRVAALFCSILELLLVIRPYCTIKSFAMARFLLHSQYRR